MVRFCVMIWELNARTDFFMTLNLEITTVIVEIVQAIYHPDWDTFKDYFRFPLEKC